MKKITCSVPGGHPDLSPYQPPSCVRVHEHETCKETSFMNLMQSWGWTARFIADDLAAAIQKWGKATVAWFFQLAQMPHVRSAGRYLRWLFRNGADSNRQEIPDSSRLHEAHIAEATQEATPAPVVHKMMTTKLHKALSPLERLQALLRPIRREFSLIVDVCRELGIDSRTARALARGTMTLEEAMG